MLSQPISILKGVGAAKQKQLNNLGVYTIGDLLNTYPRDYQDRSKITSIDEISAEEVIAKKSITIKATPASSVINSPLPNKKSIQRLKVTDEGGDIDIIWFNQPYLTKHFSTSREYYFYGKVELQGSKIVMISPEIEHNPTEDILPIYPLTHGIKQFFIRNCMRQAMGYITAITETLPPDIITKYNLIGKQSAIKNIHFPLDFNAFADARRRLAFDEIYEYLTNIKQLKNNNSAKYNTPISADLTPFYNRLKFTLTNAQKKAIDDIAKDLASKRAMNRLLQGDVGSGKTVCAMAAMYITKQNNAQSCIMAPTEILAKQHYESISAIFNNVFLLTGSLSATAKRKIKEDILNTPDAIVIGTHALLQDDTKFDNLSLVIADEQHRFGVNQRKQLTDKGYNPNFLLMTATPIPRTLTMTLYADLNLSIIDEMPPDRQTVDTFALNEGYRARITNFIAKQVDEGRQVYIVCPLVEESEAISAKNATDYVENLAAKLPKLRIALLHGKLKASDKSSIMLEFAAGDIDVLVSTTVIEVGINVPNANLMIIEDADRFGLSQLHQLRGRVGRGKWKSYCVMFSNSKNEKTLERLKTMTQTNSGFVIAEKDLELRGGGDLFGTRQWGMPDFKVINLLDDIDIVMQAKGAVFGSEE
ncbi:MAG: ATP-dependent DNA helicase RecG [Clostridiales bacterium]|nr:ATP-dependent DNA helicase RecG [Clostridiales bacterium]